MDNEEKNGSAGKNGRPRRVRMTRQTGQALIISHLCGGEQDSGQIEIRVSQVCAGGTAILEIILPDGVFVERKETLDSVRALFPRPALGIAPA